MQDLSLLSESNQVPFVSFSDVFDGLSPGLSTSKTKDALKALQSRLHDVSKFILDDQLGDLIPIIATSPRLTKDDKSNEKVVIAFSQLLGLDLANTNTDIKWDRVDVIPNIYSDDLKPPTQVKYKFLPGSPTQEGSGSKWKLAYYEYFPGQGRRSVAGSNFGIVAMRVPQPTK